MLKKRIIICLDVKDGRTTKGVKFQNNIDIGDPVEMAAEYYRQGVDELVFYDIIASARGRGPILDLISRVAQQVFIPFCVGGGIGTIEDIRSTILAGADNLLEDIEDNKYVEFQDIYFFKKTLRIISEKIGNFSKEEFLEYLLDNIKFLYIDIPEDKATKVFSMMNGSKAIMKDEELRFSL